MWSTFLHFFFSLWKILWNQSDSSGAWKILENHMIAKNKHTISSRDSKQVRSNSVQESCHWLDMLSGISPLPVTEQALWWLVIWEGSSGTAHSVRWHPRPGLGRGCPTVSLTAVLSQGIAIASCGWLIALIPAWCFLQPSPLESIADAIDKRMTCKYCKT
jgi:hypothetical protein